jgi:ankyrin repeat protein
MIWELLNDGCVDPTVINRNGKNCLELSAWYGHDSIFRLLLDDPRVDPNVVNYFGDNCLHLSAMAGSVAIFKLQIAE